MKLFGSVGKAYIGESDIESLCETGCAESSRNLAVDALSTVPTAPQTEHSFCLPGAVALA